MTNGPQFLAHRESTFRPQDSKHCPGFPGAFLHMGRSTPHRLSLLMSPQDTKIEYDFILTLWAAGCKLELILRCSVS
jgi:hypothetical protein